MKTLPGPLAAAIAIACSAPLLVGAGPPLARGGLPNFDIRRSKDVHALRPAAGALGSRRAATVSRVAAARRALAAARADVVSDHDPVSGVAVALRARGGVLAGPATGADPQQVVRSFLAQHAGVFGLSPSQARSLHARATHDNPARNLQWVTLEQEVGGLPVFRGRLRAAVTPAGALVALAGELAGGLEALAVHGAPAVMAADAVRLAAADVGVGLEPGEPRLLGASPDGRRFTFARGALDQDVAVDRVVFPLGPGEATTAWRVLLVPPGAGYYVLVDDASGRVVYRTSLLVDQSRTATFAVYTGDSPAPLSPTPASPGSGVQGAAVPRSTLTLVSESPTVNLLGWIPDDSNVSTGNNVDAGLDVDGTDGIDPGGRAVGTCAGPSPACRNFVFAYGPPPGGADLPTSLAYRRGIVTDVFFWVNRWHDRVYALGFTEAAGNFQQDNFGRGGLGADPVRAEAQDASEANNANMLTPADGMPPRMQMFLWDFPTPDRDGDLDHEIVLHELTHGLSNRLVGDAAGLDNVQGIGMGEGWSDFYALALLAEPGDDPHGTYAFGAYSTYRLAELGTDNYFYGIRRFPYSTDLRVSPLTFADVDPGQLETTDGMHPESPIRWSNAGAQEVHNVGEVWAAMLWEARANLVARLGPVAGGERILQVVTDGLKLTPNSPTFTQARDAIITADCAGFGGADEIDLWRGFAKRGLGWSAVAPPAGSLTLAGTVEAFDLPITVLPVAVNDAAGNRNASVDPGEQVELVVPLRNDFTCTTLGGLTGTLTAVTPGVTVLEATGAYGDLVPGGSSTVGAPYRIVVDPGVPCGAPLVFVLRLAADGGAAFEQTVTVPTGSLGSPTTVSYTGVPVSIPDNDPGGAAASLDVPLAQNVGAVSLAIGSLRHSFLGDLRVELVAPDGTATTVADRLPNGAGVNSADDIVDTVLRDDAETSIQTQGGSIAGLTLRPAQSLAAFHGRAAGGTWRLRAVDLSPIDTGSIDAWALTVAPRVCGGPPATARPVAGRKLQLKDRAGDPSRRSLKFQAKDPGVSGAGIDPAAHGAFVLVFNAAGGGDSACLALPAARWTARGGGRFDYRDGSLAAGPVKAAVLRDGQIKVTARGHGSSVLPYSLDEPAQGAVGVVFRTGSTAFCTSFGGVVRRDSGTNPPNPGGRGTFSASAAPAPGDCPAPPTPCP